MKKGITKRRLGAFLLSCLMLSAPASARDWVLLAVPGLTPIYIDRDSIKRTGDVVDVQVLMAGTFNRELFKRLWCKDWKSATSPSAEPVIAVYPGSDDAAILIAVCKQ